MHEIRVLSKEMSLVQNEPGAYDHHIKINESGTIMGPEVTRVVNK